MAKLEPAVPFARVLNIEHQEINHARDHRDKALEDARTPRSIEALREQFVGLAFSGGGIRSATFNLGVLQGLAELGLLPIVDYISTVSGGGYIGTWLTAWIRRKGLPSVVEALKTARPSGDGVAVDTRQHRKEEPHEIRWLREYSNYLTPKLGLVSGDTWAFVGAYLRNLILNQLILVLVLLSVLLLPRPFVLYFWEIAGISHRVWPFPLVGGLLMCLALGTTLANLSSQAQEKRLNEDIRSVGASGGWIDGLVVFPILAGLWILWAWVWSTYRWWVLVGVGSARIGLWTGGAFVLLWFLGWLGGEYVRELVTATVSGSKGRLERVGEAVAETLSRRKLPVLKVILWAGPAGFVGGLLLAGVAHWVAHYLDTSKNPSLEWQVVSWGFPVVVLIFLFMQTLHIGLVGRNFSEDAREWWGRLAGSLLLAALCLSALFAIALDGPQFIQWLGENHHGWMQWLLATIWAAVTAGGLAVGKSTAKSDAKPGVSRALMAKVAPPVFILGLLLILSVLALDISTNAHGILQPLINWEHTKLGRPGSLLEALFGRFPSQLQNPNTDWGTLAREPRWLPVDFHSRLRCTGAFSFVASGNKPIFDAFAVPEPAGTLLSGRVEFPGAASAAVHRHGSQRRFGEIQ